MEDLDPRQEEVDAIARIAATRDGMLLHRYLRRILECVSPSTTDHHMLQIREGARILARDLMAHMAPAIENRLGRPDTADATLLPAAGKPTASRRIAGRRRVAPDPSVTAFIAQHAADAEP